MEQFFGRLGGETDPIAIASLAGKQPVFPDLKAIGPDPAPVTPDYGYVVSETNIPAETIADTSGNVAAAVAAAQFDGAEQAETAEQPAAEAAVVDTTAEAEAKSRRTARGPGGRREPEPSPQLRPSPSRRSSPRAIAAGPTPATSRAAPKPRHPLVGVMDPDVATARRDPVESGVGAARSRPTDRGARAN